MNIDKDIEILKDLISFNIECAKNCEGKTLKDIYIARSKSIENVLKELEKQTNIAKKEYNEHMEKKRQNEVLENNNRILSKELEKYKKAYELETYERQKFIEELETWKKIAEKLALTILEIDIEGKDVYETICKSTPTNRCDEFEEGNCDKCVLDWARKEVEKDES